MNLPVTLYWPAGCTRLFCIAVCLLIGALPAFAATLEWQALPDRERITITLDESGGRHGAIGRIAPTGILIPFTDIPAGLHVGKAPEGAAIFQGTKQQGRALVLETKTPEFGFVVSRQTRNEIVVDFFHNPLGARWKPTQLPPTTEIAPDRLLGDLAKQDETSRALETDPAGKKSATQAAAAERPAPAESAPQNTTASPPVSQATGIAHPVDPAPLVAPPAEPPAPAKPVSVLTGSPLYATQSTQMADQAAQDSQPARPATTTGAETPPPPPPGDASGFADASPPVAAVMPPASEPSFAPLVDNRAQTAARAAPLPQPSPPTAELPGGLSGELPGGVAAEGATPPPPVSQSIPQRPAEQGAGQAQGRTTAPAFAAPVDFSTPRASSDVSLPVGVGMRHKSGVYGGSINTGGFEAIPQRDLSSSAAGDAVPEQAAPQPPGATPQEQDRQIVYTDAEGNPVEPPPDPAELMPEIAEHVKAREFRDALNKATALLERGIITPEQREELLHIRAEMLFAANKDNLAEHYLAISDASTQAINFNQKSWRNAAALLRLGYMNLKLNKIPEAEAHCNMLRRLFPDDENVPLTYYYWGDYYFGKGDLQRAADEFQYALQKYPNSRYARELALGLARSFYQMEYYEQSFKVVDYIERRWERFYVQYPPFLNMMGDVAYRLNKLDLALKHYWLYLNLEPKGAEADIILTRIGDIYSQQREKEIARQMYTENARLFPDKDGGLVAMMRLAEEGVNDDPTIAGMFSLFESPNSLEPVEVYRTIIDKHPQSDLVPLAELKLALWHLWNKDYMRALDLLSALEQKYPKHELVPKAKEIALQTFAVIAAESRRDQRYDRMRELWEKYPIVRGQEETLNPESRITLGVSYRQGGKPNEALKAVEPFFLGHKIPEYSEVALSLVLAIYLEYDQWGAIREVARRVESWELSDTAKNQLDYALALAAENLGESEQATPLWQRLYDSDKLPPAQMAYAVFFLARDAERSRELEKAYNLGSDALSRLIAQVERNPNDADIGKIKTQLASLMDVAETAGKLREALVFAEQYLQYIPAGDSERQAVRYRMARIYKKRGDNETWRKLLGEITAEAPESVYGRLSASELKAANIAQDAAQYSPTGQL